MTHVRADRWRGSALLLLAALASTALAACTSSSPKPAAGTASVVSAPVRMARTRLGAVGYRVVGRGSPLVLIMGYGLTMERPAPWSPTAPGTRSTRSGTTAP